MAKTKQQGYLKTQLGGSQRTLHFSMNFLFVLEEVTGKSFQEFGDDLAKQQGLGILRECAIIVFAAMVAFDQEEENEIDYNLFKVRNWVSDKVQDDKDFVEKIVDSLKNSTIVGKQKAEAAK